VVIILLIFVHLLLAQENIMKMPSITMERYRFQLVRSLIVAQTMRMLMLTNKFLILRTFKASLIKGKNMMIFFSKF